MDFEEEEELIEENVEENEEEQQQQFNTIGKPSVKLMNYNGNIKNWFSRFELIANLSNWTDEEKVLMVKVHMVGPAIIFNDDDVEYAELKDCLIKTFDKTPSLEVRISQLFSRKKNVGLNNYAIKSLTWQLSIYIISV
jgi:hypothetical protein